jgi:excisionase family DNA binding protein
MSQHSKTVPSLSAELPHEVRPKRVSPIDEHDQLPVRGRSKRRGPLVPERFFTILQVADLLQVCDRTVRRWIEDSLLPAYRFNGIVRVAEADLLAFLTLRRGH